MSTASGRWVFSWGVIALLAGISLFGAMARPVAAQDATPLATPVAAGGVPCTTLFGIEDASAACALVVHAAPDVGPVDVYLDGTLALPAVDYGILGDFVEVPAGEHQIQITAAGGDPADAVLDETVTFETGVAYEVAAVGLADDLQLLTLAINTVPVPADSARIRAIHAAPDAPAIDVVVSGGEVLIADVDYLGVTSELAVPAGVYALEVRPAGADEVVVSIGDTVLDGSVSYSLYILGLVADRTIGGFLVPVAVPVEATEANEATPVPATTPVP
jgi:hypothetical protein